MKMMTRKASSGLPGLFHRTQNVLRVLLYDFVIMVCKVADHKVFLSCRGFRRASMDLPLAVRFKHLKATSKETVGVYRLDQSYLFW